MKISEWEEKRKHKKAKKVNQIKMAERTCRKLREKSYKREIAFPKQVFHISDDFGNVRNLTIRGGTKSIGISIQDANAVISSFLEALTDAIANGETVAFQNFGTFSLRFRPPHKMNFAPLGWGAGDTTFRRLADGEVYITKEKYIPKFVAGQNLIKSAKIYGAYVEEADDFNNDIIKDLDKKDFTDDVDEDMASQDMASQDMASQEVDEDEE